MPPIVVTMPATPSATPDGPKVRALIWATGDPISDWARKAGVPAFHIYEITGRKPHPISIRKLRPVAEALGLKVSDISDWDGDDRLSA